MPAHTPHGATPAPSPLPPKTGTGPNPYLRAKILSASPEQLQLMLFDGAIRFGEQARAAMLARDYEQSYGLIIRCRKIVQELSDALRPRENPEIAGNLAALYDFAHRRLVEASVERDVIKLDEALEVVRYQRETWQMLLDKLAQERTRATATAAPTPGVSLCA